MIPKPARRRRDRRRDNRASVREACLLGLDNQPQPLEAGSLIERAGRTYRVRAIEPRQAAATSPRSSTPGAERIRGSHHAAAPAVPGPAPMAADGWYIHLTSCASD